MQQLKETRAREKEKLEEKKAVIIHELETQQQRDYPIVKSKIKGEMETSRSRTSEYNREIHGHPIIITDNLFFSSLPLWTNEPSRSAFSFIVGSLLRLVPTKLYQKNNALTFFITVYPVCQYPFSNNNILTTNKYHN